MMQKLLWATILPCLLSGCVPGQRIPSEALCDGTRTARANHAAALAVSPDDRAVVTGARLIALVDEGCK